MITASHNNKDDNGIKLIDPDGSFLLPELENDVTIFCQNDDFSTIIKNKINSLRDILNKRDIVIYKKPILLIGRDNRKSSPELKQILFSGLNIINAV